MKKICIWPWARYSNHIPDKNLTILIEKILQLKPSKIFMSKHNIYTGTGNGILLIKKLQLEGKRTLSSKEFIAGYYEETSEFNS